MIGYNISTLCRRYLLLLSLIILTAVFTSCRVSEEPVVSEPEEAASDNPAIASGELKAGKITNKNDLAAGPWATGYLGDYLLENDLVKVVINAPEHQIGGIKGGGHIVDLCRTEYTYDYIRAIYSRVNAKELPDYVYEDVRVRTTGYEENGAAIIVSGKSENPDRAFAIQTEYLLRPGSRAIEITTTVNNLSTGTLSRVIGGDLADWGACSTFVGNFGVIKRGKIERLDNIDWFSGYLDDFSAGFAVDNPHDIQGKFYEAKSVVSYNEKSLRPGQSFSYKRYLVVSDKNLSRISDYAYELRKSRYGFISGTVVQPDTGNKIPNVDVRFIISRLGRDVVKARPYTRTFSDEYGQFEVMVPEGSYFIQTEAFARKSARRPLSFFVPDGNSYVTELKVSRPSTLDFTCRDDETGELLPCKLTFVSIPPTDFVNNGPGDDLYARNVYYSATGDETIKVPTGRYKVIFSRGPEYNTYEEEILIAYTTDNEINATLKHVMDIEGYIAADIGVRTDRSGDCFVSPEDRVITAAAEGVEYLVTADRNQATDLAPAVESAGLSSYLKTGVGKKIEFMGSNNLGHFLVWPLSGQEIQAAADNAELAARDPEDLIDTFRSKYPGAMIQANRVLFPKEGYYSQHGYDHEKQPVIEDDDFSYDFDLLEVWEGKRMGITRQSLDAFMDTWLGGYTNIKPSAGSFSHKTWGEEVGYPRVYVMTPNDNPVSVTDEDIKRSFMNGNVVITNGPFIKFTVNGQPPGSLVTDTDGEVDCHMEVYAPPWVTTSHIDVNMDGIFLKRIIQKPSREVQRFPSESSPEGAEDFKIDIEKDSLINVVVVGSGASLSPVVPPAPFQGSAIMPFAVTAPIIVDYDGNGEYDPPPEDMIGM